MCLFGPAYHWAKLFLIVVLSGPYVELCRAQAPFSDDSHWDPQFGPPALFANPYNVEATEDYVIISGQINKVDGSREFGTVYRAVEGNEVHSLSIPGWEEATIVAGEKRIYAKRGWPDVELAEFDLIAGRAFPIPNPPTSSPQFRFTTFRDTLFVAADREVYRWAGEAWERLGPPLDFSVYDDWVVGKSGVFVAVGPGSICDPQNCKTALWHLENGTWTQIGITGNSTNPPVSALAVDSQGRLVIAGDFIEINDRNIPRIARWDGRTWSALGTIGLDEEVGFVADLVAVDTVIYVAGTGDLVLEWNGASWNRLGARPNDFVRKFAVGNNQLFVSGWFTAIGDTAAYRVAEWSVQEKRWLPILPVIGSGIDGYVEALTVGPERTVFASGFFAAAGDAGARNIARWDGNQWRGIGEGVTDVVIALATDGVRLYAGTPTGVAQTDLQNPSWSYMPDLPDGRGLRNVDDLLVFGNTLYASATAGADLSQIWGVFRWTGSEWQTLLSRSWKEP